MNFSHADTGASALRCCGDNCIQQVAECRPSVVALHKQQGSEHHDTQTPSHLFPPTEFAARPHKLYLHLAILCINTAAIN